MDKLVSVLLQAMREAGEAILTLQRTGFTVSIKSNHDIVTKADLLANDILRSRLTTAFPDTGWLSEESVDDRVRLNCERVWIVDPIDGTKEYATGIPEYAISVALVEHGEPVLAAVFNPASEELFYAIKGKGAWLHDQPIHCLSVLSGKDFLLLASRSEYKRGEWDQYQKQHRVKQVGSIAYKLALVAAGRADATFSLGPKNEWDIAAGVLLVTEAGGRVTDKLRKPLVFNRQDVKVNGIVASSAMSNEGIFALIA
jgi:myo-inositol-1(or 4)-monophosphatase